jgi:hypothetical protein
LRARASGYNPDESARRKEEKMAALVMTMVEADVPSDRWPELLAAWRALSGRKPSQLVQSFLVQGLDGRDTWCTVALWQSDEALEEYRASVDEPGAMKMFRAVGAEPVMARFEVVDQG